MIKGCVFCKIVRGEIPCYKLCEDNEFLAILDAFPVMLGQVLIFPKNHIEPYIFDVDDNLYCRLLIFSKKVAKSIDSALNPIKTGLVIEGLEINHIHVKLFPLTNKKGYQMKLLDPLPSEKEMIEIANKLRKNFD
ncbi:MAG: HIT domain-containing protein [Nanoarchaeota archaeon]|nr:HIT domain-containing protein [Nanoarchaeota archaeon]